MKGCKSRRKSRKRNVRKNKGGKKKRHIITRKNKRKRRRRTKKRKRGGVKTKSAFTKSSGLLPNRGVIKPLQHKRLKKPLQHKRLKELKKRLTRSPTIKNLQQLKNFKPIAKKTEEQSNEHSDSDSDSELSTIFHNMQTPTEGSREHNSEKTLLSPKPDK